MAKKPADRPASMTEVIALFQAAKASLDEVTAYMSPDVKSMPDPEISSETPLKRPAPPRIAVDSSIFARVPWPVALRTTTSSTSET